MITTYAAKGFFSKQSQTSRIQSFNKGTCPCVSVDNSIIMFNSCKHETFANFVDLKKTKKLRQYSFSMVKM